MVIDGREIAGQIIEKLKKRPMPEKFLAAIVVGDDPATESFVKQKEIVAKELGVDFRVVRFPADILEARLIEEVKKIAEDQNCGGVVLQLPLPAHLNRESVIEAIPIEKDVDALRGGDLVSPPAVGVVQEILKIENCKIENLTVAVVGMGFLVGQPITWWLKGSTNSHELAEVITLDIGDNLARLKDADVVILGVGKAGLVKPEMLKGGALVIDFGYSRGEDSVLHGDFDPSHESLAMSHKLRYTPVPHGTGPILVAKLFENFYVLNQGF